MWDFFAGINNNRSSIIALQYFLLCIQSEIAFMYVCQINGDIFKALFDINMRCYQNMVRFHSIFLNIPKALKHEMHPSNLTLIKLHTRTT